GDRDNFSHAIPRRLSAEELMDAVSSAAGARPHFPDVPDDTTASELVDPHVARDGFLDVFGRPPRESSCECERRSDFSLPQALNLVNGKTIADAVADPNGRVARLVLSGRSDEARAVAHRFHRPDGSQPSSLLLLARAGGERRQQVRRRARLGIGEERDHGLPAGWAVAYRYLGSEARCAGEHPRRIQTD